MISNFKNEIPHTINQLCEDLLQDLCPNKQLNETSALQLWIQIYELLLKKPINSIIIDADNKYDPFRELDVILYEMGTSSRNNTELEKRCEELRSNLHFLFNEIFFEKNKVSAENENSGAPNFLCEPRLLVPGPFHLHHEYSNSINYNPLRTTLSASVTFKNFENIKDSNNPYLPRFLFTGEPRKLPEFKNQYSEKKTDTHANKNTWQSGLNIKPSAFRFFNLLSQSSTEQKEDVSDEKVLSKDSCQELAEGDENSLKKDVYNFNRNWEFLGHERIPKYLPFASETDTVLHLHGAFETACGGSFTAKMVPVDKFVFDLKALTIGIQSDTFYHDELMIFHMVADITIPEITPTVIHSFVTEFLECGTCFKRLQLLIKKNNYKLMYDGFMFKALCGAIENYLVMFRQFIVSFNDKTPLQYYTRVRKMLKQMILLSHILAVHPNVDASVKPSMGSQFLGYLYKEIINVTQKDFIMLLMYILKRCCHVYFKHLQKWLFYGVLEDPSNELFICFSDHYRPNTKYFYDKAYFVHKESVPGFFQGFEDQILQCGKYMQLLKAFKPNHPLFSVEYPSLVVCLSFDEIQLMETNCKIYKEKVREVCGQPVSVRNMFLKREESRRHFYSLVADKCRQNFEQWTIEQEHLATQQAADKKKRLDELNEQLLEIHERKVAERKANLELELRILKEGQEIEDKRVIQENLDVQKRIDYYKELNEMIEEKKQRIESDLNKAKAKFVKDQPSNTRTTDGTDDVDDIEEDIKPVNENDDIIEIPEIPELFQNLNIETDIPCSITVNENIENSNASNNIENNNMDQDEKQQEQQQQPHSLKKSSSDFFNSNEVISEFHKNRNKIMSSNVNDYFGSDSKLDMLTQGSTTATTSVLTENPKIVLIKDITSTTDDNLNQVIPGNAGDDGQNDITQELSELQQNRKKMMHNDTFAAYNKGSDRRPLNLDLKTERSRNRRKVLESEFNILTGICTESTPMSTTSDTPSLDDKIDDFKNANIIKKNDGTRLRIDMEAAQSLELSHVRMDKSTAIIEETPECALNTAGLLSRNGFNFQSLPKKDQPNEILSFDDKTLTNGLIQEKQNNEQPYNRCKELIASNFKCDPLMNYFVLPTKNKSKLDNIIEHDNNTNGDNDNTQKKKKKNCDEKNLNSLSAITLTDFLQKSVIVPMQAHVEILNNEILRIYLYDLGILGHFKSLRNYFLLMDGEFGSFICDGLISRLENGAKPTELLNYQMLHSIIDNALGSSIIGNDKNAENLSFIVDDMPEKFDLNSPSALSNLSLSYRVTWPINLILNPETLEQYSNIFKYLVKLRRISWVLEESFQILKEIVKKNGKEMLLSPQYRRVQQIRHKFFHFVHALKNHITSRALQGSWKTFKDDLLTAKSMEDLYRKHTIYVKRILFLCMLNRRSVEFYNTIENIFKVTLRFYHNLKSRQWKRKPGEEFFTHSRYERLLADETDFQKFIKYTIYLGNKIVRHGYQEEIGEFINLINFNHYYVVDV